MKYNLSVSMFCVAVLAVSATARAQIPKVPKDRANSTAENAEKAAVRAKAAERAGTASRQADKAAKAEKTAAQSQSAQKAAEKAESAQKAAQKAANSQKAAERARQGQKAADAAARAAKPVPPPALRQPNQPTQPKEPVTPKVANTPAPKPPGRPKIAPASPQKPASQTAARSKSAPPPRLGPTRQAAAEAAKDNAVRPPSGGPDPGLAGPNRDAAKDKAGSLLPDALEGQQDRTAALKNQADALKGTTPSSSAVDSRLNDSRTQRPAFDQGFADKPVVTAEDAAQRDVTNPNRGLTSGTVVTGPLSDAARRGSGVTGIAQQGIGAVGDQQTDAAVAGVAAAVAVGNAVPATAPIVKAGAAGFAVGTFLDKLSGGALSSVGVPGPNDTTKLDLMYEAVATRGVQTHLAEQAAKKPPVTVTVTTTTTVFDENGNPVSTSTRTESPPPAAEPKASPPSTGQPVDENPPLKFDIVGTDTVAEQLRQAQLPRGAGVIDPAPEGGPVGGPATGASPGTIVSAGGGAPGNPTAIKGAVPQDGQMRRLVGSPTAPGVINESGGNKGLDTFDQSAGAGGIRPTDDATVTASGIQENPEDVFGNPVGPAGLDARPGTSSQAAGVFPPTLTLTQPLPEDKTAVARTIGPVGAVSSASGNGNLTVGGSSESASSSGSLTAVSGTASSSTPAETVPGSAPPVLAKPTPIDKTLVPRATGVVPVLSGTKP